MNKNIILLLCIIMIGSVSAWSTDEFNNSLTEENLTFTGNENVTRWLNVSENTYLTKGFLNLTGNKLIQNYHLDNPNRFETGEGYPFSFLKNVDTYIFYYNNRSFSETIKIDELGFLLMKVGSPTGTANISIYNSSGNKVQTKEITISELPTNSLTKDFTSVNFTESEVVSLIGEVSLGIEYFGDSDSSNHIRIAKVYSYNPNSESNWGVNSSETLFNSSNSILLEKIRFANPLNNSYIKINNTKIWNYTGEFETTEQTSNFAQSINNYISTATATAGYYQIPFIFHSDTAGLLEYSDLTFSNLGIIENSQTYNDASTEFAKETLKINISYDSLTYSGTIIPRLIYNGTSYVPTKIGTGNTVTYSANIITPEVTADTNVSFYWTFSGVGASINSTTYNQTVQNLAFDDCSAYTYKLYNFTLKDEETNIALNETGNNTLIEVDFYLSPRDETSQDLHYYDSFIQENPALICSNVNIGTNKYTVDITASYKADNYVQEFYYVDRGDATNSTQNISLMDLLADDSTTFLFSYTDANSQKVSDIIVHTFRKYIGEGVSREVERSKGDNAGQTHVHLVEEDVIYYFVISQYGTILYTSDEYNAKCLSNPCSISLTASQTAPNWSIIDNEGGKYIISTSKATRIVTTSFQLDESVLVNVTLYKMWNMSGTPAFVNTSSLTASAGSISLLAPLSYDNSIFFVSIYRDNEFIKSEWVSLEESGVDYFGTFGALLGGFVVLALMLMAVTEGAGFIVVTILALLIIGIMKLVDLGWLAVISICCAGGIIVWKLINRRGTRQ